MYKARLLEISLSQAIKSFPAVFIGGPRRSGKTTLACHTGRDYRYVLLDELDIRKYAVEDPRGFLQQYPPPVIIDEIQNVPELLPYIKARIDADKKPGQWILTGSQQWALMKNIGETLAGRIAILHIYPFSINEAQGNHRPQLENFESFWEYLGNVKSVAKKAISESDWIIKGGYPEVLFGLPKANKMWFASYVQTYLDRDVRGNIKESNLRDFERFISLLATRTAQQLNMATLASDVGTSIPTIKAWLSLLEASGLIFFVTPYYKNFGKRLIKSPKCYFIDTGLVCYLVGLQDAFHAIRGPMAGALFETACVSEIYKRLSVWQEQRSLYYFRSSDGLEVDMLIERGGEFFPLEVKLTSTVDSSKASNLIKWRRISNQENTRGIVISSSPYIGEIAPGVKNLHFSCL